MENVKKLIEDYKSRVLDSFPSVYTKGDVTHLLDLLSEEIDTLPKKKPLLEIDIEEFKEDVLDQIDKIVDNYDFEECVELELSGREIQVTFNERYTSIKDELRDGMNDFLDKSDLHKLVGQPQLV